LIYCASCERPDYLRTNPSTIQDKAFNSVRIKGFFLSLEKWIFKANRREFQKVGLVAVCYSRAVHYFIEFAISILFEREAVRE
jgi:hypothetical protein